MAGIECDKKFSYLDFKNPDDQRSMAIRQKKRQQWTQKVKETSSKKLSFIDAVKSRNKSKIKKALFNNGIKDHYKNSD